MAGDQWVVRGSVNGRGSAKGRGSVSGRECSEWYGGMGVQRVVGDSESSRGFSDWQGLSDWHGIQ